MNADERGFRHSDITELVIGVLYDVYNELGQGWFRGQKIGSYEADLVINGVVLLELKACRALDPSHEAQLLNYLRCTLIEVGLLLNFGPRAQVRRFVFQNERKKISVHQRSSVAKGVSG